MKLAQKLSSPSVYGQMQEFTRRGGERGRLLTGINLHDMRNSQAHFIPIHSWSLGLQRVPLEIHGLQRLFPAQLALDVVETIELVIRCPELLQIRQRGEMLELGKLVVRAVEDLQRCVGLEAGKRGDGVVRDV